MDVSIVIPTYNEAENIKELIPKTKSVLKNYNYEIIVVDDNSVDGTAEIAKSLGARVIIRPYKMGLASAIFEGIKNAKSELVVVMDADLQHPPEYIPKLIKNSEGYDIVIASRYIEGSKIEGWNFFRKKYPKLLLFLLR